MRHYETAKALVLQFCIDLNGFSTISRGLDGCYSIMYSMRVLDRVKDG